MDKREQTATGKAGLISIQTAAVFLRLVLIAMALVIPPALVSIFIADDIDTTSLNTDLLVNKILLSPEGLGWRDEATWAAPLGVIDMKKLSAAAKDEKLLMSRLVYAEPMIGAKITVGEATAYYNKELYEDYAAMAKTGLPGRGGAVMQERTIAVILRDGSRDRLANANIEAVIPR